MENKEQLTPKQSIDILYQITGEIALKRKEQEIVMQALQVLNSLIPTEKPE